MAIEFAASAERVEDDACVVEVRGEVDLFTVPELKQLMGEALEDGCSALVVDLTGATFIDSSSLGVLISANRRTAARGGRLVVATDVPAILKTFEITGLDEVMPVVPSREAALALAAGAAADA